MANDFLSGESLYRDVITYSQLGEHRTATEGEEITTTWITEQLRLAGLQTSFQTFPVRQFFVRETSLIIGEETVACFPWWYPCGTGPRPIKAPLTPFKTGSNRHKGTIVLVKSPPGRQSFATSRSEAEQIIGDLTKKGALAVVVVVTTPSGELAAINTSEQVDPWQIPVVLVGSRDETVLTAAAEQNTEVSLLVDGRDEPQTETRNVFGRHNRDGNIIVVSTPKSGWFHCGGERGPGVALSLALARWVGKRQPSTSYWFDFNSGHELNNLGTRKFLGETAPPPGQVRCWLHLGANIATWDWAESGAGLQRQTEPGKYIIRCGSKDLLSLVAEAFAGMPGVKPDFGPGIGELTPVLETGYRGFGVYGGRYRFFHTPDDGPQGTAPELLEPMALALTKALESIETFTA